MGRKVHNMATAIKDAIYLKSEQPYPEQKHWQIHPATYVGQSFVFHPRTKIK